jgi:uncharacterized LabA/DUF88 family protein
MNIAYIDNQNLYLATRNAPQPWRVDMRRFRVYLREKYDVETAYLFMGAFDPSKQTIYERFQRYGYVLVWRLHAMESLGHKKGNVDTDIVFFLMRDCYEGEGGIVLVSGDGDFCRTIEHIRDKGRLKKILLPSHRNASSLYKRFGDEYRAYLDSAAMRRRFGVSA